jgi:myosin heavy subunit
MPSASEEARLKAEAGAETEDEGTTWWVPVDDDDEWVLCTIEKKISGGKVTLGNRGALTPEVHLKRLHQPKLVNSKVILTEEAFAKSCTRAINTEVLSDLVMMSDINSASMLHTLRQRYDKDEIYTAIGGVLIAINPYKKLELCSTYTKVVDEDTPPHVSKTAATAYASLVDGDGAQSILISGESGAGKTETTKIAMACLTAISGSSGKTAEAALESGIVLETFGNAKTVFNNNSSRFGKWCAVHFDARGKLTAARVESYLLEKSRIVGAAAGERNYHLFYQLLAGATAEERTAYSLRADAQAYGYTKGEAKAIVVAGLDDAAEWAGTKARLATLGVGPAAQVQLFEVYAGVLAAGDLAFKEGAGGNNAARVITDRALLATVARLLQVDEGRLEQKLTTKELKVGTELVTVILDDAQCVDMRDAMNKAVYTEMFALVVRKINAALGAERIADGDDAYIGLLDIFGFENFGVNGFEQLCINFTNERLQQHFMGALIQREQASRDPISAPPRPTHSSHPATPLPRASRPSTSARGSSTRRSSSPTTRRKSSSSTASVRRG